MADKSKIEWTEATWNPTTGCSKVSTGCAHCYAEREWTRLSANPRSVYYGRKFTDVQMHTNRLDQPMRWKKPRRIFVDSMSDLFHSSVTFPFIANVFDIMCHERSRQHTFQILTKRPERALAFIHWIEENWPGDTPASLALEANGNFGQNVWMGVSAEDQSTADERIPKLLRFPAAVRFVSCEPLLFPIDLRQYAMAGWHKFSPKLHWVIAGGESGPEARPMHPDWVRSLRDQCLAVDTPFFFKQWGEWCTFEQLPDIFNSPRKTPYETTQRLGTIFYRVGKKAAGKLLDGREWIEMPKEV